MHAEEGCGVCVHAEEGCGVCVHAEEGCGVCMCMRRRGVVCVCMRRRGVELIWAFHVRANPRLRVKGKFRVKTPFAVAEDSSSMAFLTVNFTSTPKSGVVLMHSSLINISPLDSFMGLFLRSRAHTTNFGTHTYR